MALAALLLCASTATRRRTSARTTTRASTRPTAGAAFFAKMKALGLQQTVMTVRFKPSEPTVIQDEAFLDRAVPEAIDAGSRRRARRLPVSADARSRRGSSSPFAFGQYVAAIARRYPFVKRFAIGNEPNQPAFVRPQFDGLGLNASARARRRAPRRRVRRAEGRRPGDPGRRRRAVTPRERPPGGGEQRLDVTRAVPPRARRLVPVERSRAAADGRSQLPPVSERGDRPARPWLSLAERGLRQPRPDQAGDLGRVRRHRPADDASTGSRSISTRSAGRSTPTGQPGYTGVENVTVADEWTQGTIYGDIIRQTACDPSIAEVNFFGFHDDAVREGFQAALHRVDGTPRYAAEAVRAAIAETVGGCTRRSVSWSPAARVVGATRPVVDAAREVGPARGAGGEGAAGACVPRAREAVAPECAAHAAARRERARLRGRRRTPRPQREADASSRRRRAVAGRRAASPPRSTRRVAPSSPSGSDDLTTEHLFATLSNRCSYESSSSQSSALALWATFARDSGAGGPERVYRVQPGDTLWSIASRTTSGDPREGVWELRERNGLSGSVIVPGQRLVLP